MSKKNEKMELSDSLIELEMRLEKARCALDYLTEGYFSEPESKHEANRGMMLLCNYSASSTMATIVDDYLYESQKILSRLQMEVQ